MNIIKTSFLYRIFAAIGIFFGNQWRQSLILSRFTNARYTRGGGIAAAAWARIWSIIRAIFRKLKLDKIISGSIFTYPAFWCGLTIAATPLVPTLVTIGLAVVSFFSLFVTYASDASIAPAKSRVNRFIFLFAFIYFASIFPIETVDSSTFGAVLHVVFALFAVLVGASVRREAQLYWIIRAFAVSGALVSAYGVYQYLFGTSVTAAWVDAKMFGEVSVRVYSTLENPNVLAEYLLLVIPFTGALIINEKKLLSRLFFIGCLGVQLLTMVLTLSRGGWVGLILAVAIFLVMLDRRFIILGIFGLIGLYFVLPDTIMNRLLSIGNLADSSSSYRLSIWLGTIAMLKTHWFSGIGPGTTAFNRVYPVYSYGAAAAQHSHNLFLQLICDAGIAGIVLFVLMLFSFWRTMATSVKHAADRRLRIISIASIAAIAGFIAQGMTDYSFYNYRVTLMFWAVIGLGIAASRLALAEGAQK